MNTHAENNVNNNIGKQIPENYNKDAISRLKKVYFMEQYRLKDEDFDGRPFDQIFRESKKIVMNGGDLAISILIIIAFVIIYISLGWSEFIQVAKNNFDLYKCDPRYIMFNGYIKPKDGESAFLSTGDYFNECLQPLAQEMAESHSGKTTSLLSSVSKQQANMPSNMTGNMSSISNSLDSIISLKQKQQASDDSSNSQTSITQLYTLDVTQKMGAFNAALTGMFQGLNISVQSGMVYLYDFFGGALVEFSVFITVFTIAAISAQFFTFGIPNFLSIPLFVLAFIFLMIFVSILIIMLIYRSVLVSVFGINPDEEIKK